MRAFLFITFLFSFAIAKGAVITGKVTNAINNEPIPFANVIVQGQTTGTTTDFDGNYTLEGISPGLYNVEASFIGFNSETQFEIEVSNARVAIVNFELQES
ncbi:MAG: carboxypeptidase-like regulatory domain-containing protein, partial [Bacteroidota bacterium]